jgi:hypothetical protein
MMQCLRMWGEEESKMDSPTVHGQLLPNSKL